METGSGGDAGGTRGRAYTDRLVRLGEARWKRVLDVQAPYRANLRRLLADRQVLDVGCGIGRHLEHLGPGSVGVDHNADSVRACRERGLEAFTPEEFAASGRTGFTGMLVAHVLEHLPPGGPAALLEAYRAVLAPGARVVLVCPQERGFRSDATHTVFVDDRELRRLASALPATVVESSSFPLPRVAGRWFTHNEFVTVADLDGAPA